MELQNITNVAEVQVSYKPKYKASERPQILKSQEAYAIFKDHWSTDKINFIEEFKVLLLNRRNRVIGLVSLSQGGYTGTVIDAKVVFAIALKACASHIILAHNHPSGEVDPSKEDSELTKKLMSAGKVLDMLVLDHLIISKDSYYSFSDEGSI